MGTHTGLKLLVYVFNFLLLLCGLSLVVGGTIVQIHFNDLLSDMGMRHFIAPLLLIVAGCCMMLIAVLGCVGVCKLWSWTLMLFAILLGAVFLMEIVGSIAAYTERSTVHSYIENHMDASMAGNGTKTPVQDKSSWDRLQRQFKCCGIRNFTDWLKTGTKQIPDSCCLDANAKECDNRLSSGVQQQCSSPGDILNCPIYIKGCLTAAEDFIRSNIGAIGGIGLGVAAFQIIGVVLAACLARKIRRDQLV